MEMTAMNFICKDNGTNIYQSENKFYREVSGEFIEVAHIMRFQNNKVHIEWIDLQFSFLFRGILAV